MRMLVEFVNGNPPGSVVTSENVLADNWYEGLPSSKPNIVFEVKTAGGSASIAADFEA